MDAGPVAEWDGGMSIRTSPWPEGVPCWTDLTVADVSAATRFYGEVLRWSFADPSDQYGGYAIAQVRGHAAAGVGPQQQPGPAMWTLYFACSDVDTAASEITQLGGQLLLPPGDVGPLGRLVIATDPSGAVFGVWQAGTHIGAEVVNEPGGLTWEDLRSADPDRARAFYTGIFGFRTDTLEMAGPDYTTFAASDGESPLGGMGGTMGDNSRGSHWLVYFGVDDASRAAEAALRGGGAVVQEVFESPFGRMAGLTDPEGALFWVVEMPASEE